MRLLVGAIESAGYDVRPATSDAEARDRARLGALDPSAEEAASVPARRVAC